VPKEKKEKIKEEEIKAELLIAQPPQKKYASLPPSLSLSL
jgi:hypothetical protein